MDNKNRFHTRGMYTLVRCEHLAVIAICAVLTFVHAREIDWVRYWVSFWIIDIVGYWPGAFVYKRRGGGPIPVLFHHLYNVTHTYLFVGSAIALWAWTIGGLEWAMVGAAVHLSVDRGVFGNVLKPIALRFEPVPATPAELEELLAESAPEGQPSGSDVPENAADMMEHPSGYLGLSRRNRIFTMPGVPGFVSYRKRGGHLVAFGGVHTKNEHWATLLDGFIKFADSQRRRVLAVQVRSNQVALFAERGFTVNQFGTNFAVQLQGYSLAGSHKVKLRNKITKAKKSGLVVREIGKELPRDENSFAMVRKISEEWLAGKKELDFMIGELGSHEDESRRVFLVFDANNSPVAFITYVPVWGERPGYLHDLTRRVPNAPVGAMELCNFTAMERLSKEGHPYLHFGFTPFITDGDEPSSASKAMTWFIGKLRQHGQSIYPAQSQADYKLKWGADILEPEFFAARPLSLRAVVDTLTLTNSI